jgi:putative ABC transport system permease protein
MNGLSWRTALLIAWRELRASRAKFLFVVLAVTIGVGSLTGVRGFSRSFSRTLLREARILMAGDMTVRVFALPNADQQAALDRLAQRGVVRTWITETVTMAASASSDHPLLVSVKAVDPAMYPFYGEVRLNPPARLRDALDERSVAVSDDTALRLKLKPGDTLRIGGQDYRVAGVVVGEPDRMTGSLNVGPRILMSRGGLDRTGLIGVGSRASQRYLFRLPASGDPGVDQVREVLRRHFPEGTIADFRETHPIITRGLSRATTFLSLIGLIALVIGAMGVASAMHGHLQQKLDSIAVMKCIGARSGQVMRIYALQTLVLGLAGGLLGVAAGSVVALAFPGLIARYFPVPATFAFDVVPAAQGILIAILITMLFTIPPLAGIRRIRPAQIFRRDMAEPEWRGRWRRWRDVRPSVLAGAAILLGTAGVAASVTEGTWREAVRTGGIFAAGLAIGLALLTLAAWLLLRGVRAFLRRAPLRLPSTVRHGIANLYRPGNQAQAAVVALGVGVMFTLTVYLVQSALVRQIRGSAPRGMANVFLLDIPGADRERVIDAVRTHPGLEAPPEVMAAVAARITAVDGVPVDKLPLREWGRRFLRTRAVTSIAVRPPETEIVAGAWWPSGAAAPMVCLTEEAARILNVRPGATIEWNIWNRTVRTGVACIQRTESIRMAARFEFIFNPGQLESFPAIYYGSARVRAANVPALQRALFERFPTVTVINVADVMAIVEEVVARINLVIRFISAFTILAGAVMVASSIAGTRFRRLREVVILKTIGGTRRRIAGIFSMEFVLLGASAGLMGTLLANAFAALILKQLLDVEFRFDPVAAAAALLLAALVAVVAGWVASFRILGQRPLEVLRGE